MRYAIFINESHRQKSEKVVVFFSAPQRRMCATKVKEFNPGPFAAMDVDAIGREMSDHADSMIRMYADTLFANPGRVYSMSCGGYVVQVFHPMGTNEKDMIEVEFLIDPALLWYPETVKDGGPPK